MKFGDSFYQRSVPEWSTHNIDYNDLKHLIKLRTTKDQGAAQIIPGKDNEARALQVFEDELYTELADQHARVNLFVRSKTGEISRKLTHLHQQSTALTERALARGLTTISVRQLEKFSRLEDQTLQAGGEILRLKQFVNANREALRKLLKKYKKWTGSAGLFSRIHRGILDHPSSISSKSFEPLLAQHIDTLAAVRRPFQSGIQWSLQPSSDPQQSRKLRAKRASLPVTNSFSERLSRQSYTSVAAFFHSLDQQGEQLELDAALGTTPITRGSSRAVYWVHPENVLELQVLILRHTALRSWDKSARSRRDSQSSSSSRRPSRNGYSDDSVNTGGSRIGQVVCDDLDEFALRQNGIALNETETNGNAAPQRAAVNVRYSSIPDVLLSVRESSSSQGKGQFCFAKCSKKMTQRLLGSVSTGKSVAFDKIDETEEARSCLMHQKHAEPLVQLQFLRSQFAGLQNSDKGGSWVTLDTEVLTTRCSKDSLSFEEQIHSIASESQAEPLHVFPNAILQVRVEGNDPMGLIEILNRSHLVSRVPGFSLEVHAVATLRKYTEMRAPHWLSLLNSDIRQLPRLSNVLSRRPNKTTEAEQDGAVPESSSAPSTHNGQSDSGFSVRQGETSATSVPEPASITVNNDNEKKPRKAKKRNLPKKHLQSAEPASDVRYWNEYDDGSEDGANEPFTILIDPEASSTGFPGVEKIGELWASTKQRVRKYRQKVSDRVSSPSKEQFGSGESSPLIDDNSPTPDSSDSETENNLRRPRNYSTMSSARGRLDRHRRSEAVLFRSCIAWFAASYILLVVATILLVTGRKRSAGQVDIGVIIGSTASLIFAIIGMGCMIARQDNLGLVHRATVSLSALLVVLANTALVYGLSHR